MKVIIHKTESGYHCTMNSRNGKILNSTEVFKKRQSAINNVVAVFKKIEPIQSVNVFENKKFIGWVDTDGFTKI